MPTNPNFNVDEFLRNGGTKIVTDPSEQKKIVKDIVNNGGTQITPVAPVSGGGGGHHHSNNNKPSTPAPSSLPQSLSPEAQLTKNIPTGPVQPFQPGQIPTIAQQAMREAQLSRAGYSAADVAYLSQRGAAGEVTAAPQGFKDRLKAFFSKTGKTGDKPTAPYGKYEYAGNIVSVPSGRGTIIDPKSGISTQANIDYAQLGIPQMEAAGRAEAVGNAINEQVKSAYNNQLQKEQQDHQAYAQSVQDRSDLDYVQKQELVDQDYRNRQARLELVDTTLKAKAEHDYQKALQTDANYQKALDKYAQEAQRLGATQDVYGNVVIPKNNADLKVPASQVARDVAREAIMFSPLGPVVGLREAETKTIVDPKTGQVISDNLTTRGNIQSAVSVLAFVPVAGMEIRAVTRDINEQIALRTLNSEIKQGVFKPTAQQIATGKVPVTFQNFNGELQTVSLNVGKKELKSLASQIDLAAKYKNPENYLGSNTKVEMVGSIEEQRVVTEQLMAEHPEYAELISRAEVGRFSRVRPSGRTETGYIVRGTQNINGKEEVVSFIFKESKAGNRYSERVVTSRSDTGVSLVAKQVSPSKLPKSEKIPVEGGPDLEIFPIDRFKAKPFKQKTQSQKIVQNINGKTITQTESESSLFAVGEENKGTLSFLDLRQQNVVLKGSKPKLVARGKSVRTEVMDEMPTLSLLEDGRVSSVRRGISRESSVSKQVKQADTLDFPVSLESKPWPEAPTKTEQPTSLLDTTPQKTPSAPKAEPKPEGFPIYVGGEGGPQAASLYEGGKTSLLDSPTSLSSLDVDAALPFQGPTPKALKNAYQDGLDLRPSAPKVNGKQSQPQSLFDNQPGKGPFETEGLLNSFNVGAQGSSLLDDQASSSREKSKHKTPTKPSLNQPQSLFDMSAQDTAQSLGQPQAQPLKAGTVPKQSLNELSLLQMQAGKLATENYPPLEPPTLFGSGGSDLPKGWIPQGKKKGHRAKQDESLYQASAGAVLLDAPKRRVTRKQAQQLSSDIFSGFELRPELEIVSGKKESRKKRQGKSKGPTLF